MPALRRFIALALIAGPAVGCNAVVELPEPGPGQGGGGAGGAPMSCEVAFDCELDEPCRVPACVGKRCIAVGVEPGTPCQGGTCDEDGRCTP